VAALKAQIEPSFRAFAGRHLRVFFDTQAIAGMEDWPWKIQRCLRDSQVSLAVLSPHFLAISFSSYAIAARWCRLTQPAMANRMNYG